MINAEHIGDILEQSSNQIFLLEVLLPCLMAVKVLLVIILIVVHEGLITHCVLLSTEIFSFFFSTDDIDVCNQFVNVFIENQDSSTNTLCQLE